MRAYKSSNTDNARIVENPVPNTYTAEKDNKFSEIEGVYSVDGR